MPTYRHGRHENGQNFLRDQRIARRITQLLHGGPPPIIEIGPGDGALTRHLITLERPLTAVEIDQHWVRRLGTTLPDVTVHHADFLAYRLPMTPHCIVGNLPFHLTTATLRRLLHAPGWTRAVLLVQWEVARRRAGIGGTSMMTVQWAPWFTFEVDRRVPRAAFEPPPNVDGGILVLGRRATPLLHPRQRESFQAFVHRVFTSKGAGMAGIVRQLRLFASANDAKRWLAQHGVPGNALPKDLSTKVWIALYRRTELA